VRRSSRCESRGVVFAGGAVSQSGCRTDGDCNETVGERGVVGAESRRLLREQAFGARQHTTSPPNGEKTRAILTMVERSTTLPTCWADSTPT
jgi:hypothetical protein